jgi:hypothetical protein
MDLTSFISPLPPVTKDLIVYVPMLQLQNGYWLAMRQADMALTNAVALYLITIP